jgi:hypothetical protein
VRESSVTPGLCVPRPSLGAWCTMGPGLIQQAQRSEEGAKSWVGEMSNMTVSALIQMIHHFCDGPIT